MQISIIPEKYMIKDDLNLNLCRQLIKDHKCECAPTVLAFFSKPIRKLSGLMSRWRKFLLWIYSILETIWSASITVVLILQMQHCKHLAVYDYIVIIGVH